MTYLIYSKILNMNKKLECFFGKNIQGLISTLLFALCSLGWMLKVYFKFSYIGYFTAFTFILSAVLSVSESTPASKAGTGLKRLRPFILLSGLLGFSYLISFFIFRINGRLLLAIYFILIIPIANCLLIPEINRKKFLHRFSLGNIIAFLVLLLLSVCFAPLTNAQYSSLVLNPNGLAFVVLPVLFSSIYLLENNFNDSENKVKTSGKIGLNMLKKLLFLATLGASSIFIILSRSRTGILSAAVIYILYFLFWIINRKKLISRLISVIFAILVSFLLIFFLLTSVNKAIIKMRFNFNDEITVFGTMKTEKINRKDFVNLEGNSVNFDNVLSGVVKRGSQGIIDDHDISSGRFDYWEHALNNLNISGHRDSDKYLVPERNLYTNDPHNMVLKIGYDLGITALLIFVAFLIMMIYMQFSLFIKSIRKRKLKLLNFMNLIIFSSFFVVGMLSTVFLPLGSILPGIFWFTLPPAAKEGND